MFLLLLIGESTIDYEKGRHPNTKSQTIIEIKEKEGNGWWMLANGRSSGYERFDEAFRSFESILRRLSRFYG